MKRLDRAIVLFLGAGVWAFTAVNVFDSQRVNAQISMWQVVDEVLYEVQRRCTVQGEVYIYSAPYGEIDSAQIYC